MTQDERIRGYLGLSARAGKVESGEFSTEKAIKSGRAYLAVVACDASSNTKKKFSNMCEYYKVPFCELFDREVLGRTVGKEFRASLAVTDAKLSEAIRGLLRGEEA